MKRVFISIILSVVILTVSKAIPANPDAAKVLLPDGSYITLILHGDEFINFTTTADGYSVVKAADGYWHYAVKSGLTLAAGSMIAHDESQRTAAEAAYLATTQKYLAPAEGSAAKTMRAARKNMGPRKLKTGQYDYSKFKGLVILVEFSDRSFLRDDAKELFNNMINQDDYTGFMSDTQIQELIPYTGSVRDYFRDNSMGLFKPQFDVIGPVKIDYVQTSPAQSDNAQTVVKKVLQTADSLVDYSQYDTDGNNEVDMVYFIFAGGGSNVSGNNTKYVWPHASEVNSLSLDGVRFGRYACSTELYGREESGTIDGIGTIVHEFSHVLGLPDEYDTDYSLSGGQSVHPAKWSVMASGTYLNKSRTPCGYSLYERYAAGFAKPTLIEGNGTFTLNQLNTSNEGYRINSAIENEYFLLENRQQTRWDEYLPGHGMLIFRVDSTNQSAWTTNDINVNPSHNYYELIRASKKVSSSGTSVTDSEGDPFPGSANITSISSETTPNLNSWTGTPTDIALSDITETDGVITFTATKETVEADIEDFETMPLTEADTTDIEGRFCLWTLASATVCAPDSSLCNGKQAAGIVRGGTITTAAIDRDVRMMTFTAVNPTSRKVVLRCYYSTNQGTTWTVLKDNDGTENVAVAAGEADTLRFRTNTKAGTMYRISQYSGSETDKCYIDDVTLTYDNSSSGIEAVTSGSASSMALNVSGNTLTVTTASAGAAVSVYDTAGTLLASKHATAGHVTVQLPRHGIYIVRCGAETAKIAL